MKRKIILSLLLLISPLIFWLLGASFNDIAVAANHGQMPVLYPGGCDAPSVAMMHHDIIHTCMTPSTHLKFMSDWIWGGDGMYSIGDLFLYASQDIWYPAIVLYAGITTWWLNNARQ